MPELSKHPNAYVRPSPSRGNLGGVARNTSDAVVLCEAAGYDIILIETVGVGQSEVMVADMVDIMVLLVAPASGDELQGIKKGIIERSDIILVNKADGEFAPAARLTQAEYISALKYVNTGGKDNWQPRVLRVSATASTGIVEFWESVMEYYQNQWVCAFSPLSRIVFVMMSQAHAYKQYKNKLTSL
jgi:LAO/AO transport system kinase